MSENRLQILFEVNLGNAIADIGRMESSLKNLDQYSGSAQKSLDGFAKTNLSGLSGSLDTISTSFGKVADGMQKMGAAMTIVSAGAGLFAKSSLDAYAQLEKQIQYDTSLLGGGKAEYEELLALSKELGSTTPFNSTDIAAGIESLAAAGYKMDEIKAAMGTVTEMSIATGEPLQNNADIIVNTLSQFNKSADQAERFADVLATGANESTASVKDFGESFKYTGSILNLTNHSIEEGSAALAVMANNGIKGTMAGTGLNQMLTRLAKQTPKGAAVLEKYGLTPDDINPATHSLEELFKTLNETGIQDNLADLKTLFGDEAAPKVATLINDESVEKYKTILNKMVNESAGANKKMADDQKQTLDYALQQIGESYEQVKLRVGEGLKPIVMDLRDFLVQNGDMIQDFFGNAVEGLTPLVNTFLDAVKGAMEWFNGLPKDMQSKIAGAAGIGTALTAIGGPLLLLGSLPVRAIQDIAGGVASLIRNITGASKAATEIEALTKAIQGLSGANVIDATIISDGGAGDKKGKNTLGKQALSMADETLLAADVLSDSGSSFLYAGEKYEKDLKKTKEKIKTASYWDKINAESSYVGVGDDLLGTDKSTVTLQKKAKAIESSFDIVDAAMVGSMLGSEVSTVKFERNTNKIKESVGDVADVLDTKKSKIVDSIDLLEDAFSLDALSKKGTVKLPISEVIDELDELPGKGNKITNAFKNVGSSIGSSISGIGSQAKTALSGVKSEMLLVGSSAATELTAMLSTLPGIGLAIAAAAGVGIAAYMTNFGDFRTNVNDIMSDLGNAASNIQTGNYREAGRNCAQAFADGLESVVDLAATTITSIPSFVVAVDEMSQGFDAALSEMAQGFGAGIRGIVDTAVSDFGTALSGATVDASRFIGNIITQLKSGDWVGAGISIADAVGSAINGASVSIDGFLNGIKSQIDNFDWQGALTSSLMNMVLPGSGLYGGLVKDIAAGYVNPDKTGTSNQKSFEYANKSGWVDSHQANQINEAAGTFNEAVQKYADANDLTYANALKLYEGSEKTAASIDAQFGSSGKPVEVTGEVDIKTGDGSKSSEEKPWEKATNWDDWSNLGGSLEDWNNRMSDEADAVESSSSSTTKSAGKKKAATEKVIESFDAATSKEEALADVIDKYGSIDAAKKAVESISIGDKEYKLGTKDGSPVLNAANDYTKAFEKKANDLQKGIGVIEQYVSGTSFQDALNKTLDRYGTEFQGQIKIGNALYDVAKKATGDSFDENGNFNEWSFYLKGANDLAKEQIEKLDNIATGETYKSGDKKGQAKTKEMSAEEWAKQYGVVRKATEGQEDLTGSVKDSTTALDKASDAYKKQLYTFEDGSQKWMTSAEAVQQWGFDPLKESGSKSAEELDKLASSAAGVDINAMFREIIGKADLGGIIAEALKDNANMSIGRNADADERKSFIDSKENTFYSEAASKAAEMFAWSQYKGSNDQDTLDSIKTELGALYVQYVKGLPMQNQSYGYARNQEVRDSLTGSEEHAMDLLAQEFIQKINSGKYEVQRYDELGNEKELKGPWSQQDRYALVEVGKSIETTGTEAKTTTPQINTLNSAFEKIGLTGSGLTNVLSNVNQSLSDHRASILESQDYLSKYNQAAGENTKYTQKQEQQTNTLMNSLGMLGTAQDMYNNYMSDGVLDATEASHVQQALAQATKLMGDAGVTAQGGISGLPGALQALASAAQAAMSAIQAAISQAQSAASAAANTYTLATAPKGKYPTMQPGTPTNFNINVSGNTFPSGTKPGDVMRDINGMLRITA
jgi:TP901 family phage tail tape measure protein